MQGSSENILNTIAQTIFDKKGFNILALDVGGVCSMTDYFLIAEGSVERHVKALGHSITEHLSEMGVKPFHVEGEKIGDWVVLDYGDILVHLFLPELRQKYALEELWHEGKIIDLNIKHRSS